MPFKHDKDATRYNIHNRWIFNHESGRVVFRETEMPGCCGMHVIHDVTFYVVCVKDKDVLYREFTNELLKNEQFSRVKKFILTDRTRSLPRPLDCGYIYEMCMGNEAYTDPSKQAPNPNTGSYVVLFELNRG